MSFRDLPFGRSSPICFSTQVSGRCCGTCSLSGSSASSWSALGEPPGFCASIAVAYLFGGVNTPTVGSSGAIYGILVAYGVVFPDQTVLFGFLVPMKSKYFVMIMGAVVFLQSYMSIAGGPGAGIAVFASLGGLVAGYLLLRGRRLQTQLLRPVEIGYRDWKLRRAKRKFEVYLRKRDSNRDRWTH